MVNVASPDASDSRLFQLPENAKMQKETVLSLVKGSTVFINYLGECQPSMFEREDNQQPPQRRRESCISNHIACLICLLRRAHDVAMSKQHKSISASDVLKALEMIEFGDLVNPLQDELNGKSRYIKHPLYSWLTRFNLVYRELAKTDKSKKGMVNLNSSSASAAGKKAPVASSSGQSISISLAKLKGKEKEKPSAPGNPMPPPFTSVPLSNRAQESISGTGPAPMDVDKDLPGTTNHASDYIDPPVDYDDSEREGLES